MGVAGAVGVAVSAQFIVTLVLVLSMAKDPVLVAQMHVWKFTPLSNINTIIRIGFPSSLQSMLYCGISMVLTRFVTSWRNTAVAVQRVGGQIESISWMTADGFGSALGLNGIWLALTVSSVAKGIIFYTVFLRMMRKWDRPAVGVV